MHAKKSITAIRRMKQARRNRLRNQPVKTRVRTSVRAALSAIEAGAEPSEAMKLTAQAARAIDKAASKGVIHKHAAARKKSRLMKHLNAAIKAVGAEN